MGNSMKKILIILISILLLSSPVIGNNHKGETLYRWGECEDDPCVYKWMGFGDKDTHPVYQGQVKDGKPNGLGVIIYPDGDEYVGEWKDDKKHGQGTYTWSDGGKYVGKFKDGRKNGQGTTIYPDGSKYIGEWRNGDMWNGTGYDKNGNIQVKFVNGKPIKQEPPPKTNQ